jgi:hemoglobin/transferrin/lactoferrin receptor protein
MIFSKFSKYRRCFVYSGSLFVQKIATRGGNPFAALRPVGFYASGWCRMNNLIFRAGHLQNVITVDEMLDNVGIFFWSSTLFGSDALGGAVP